MKKHHSEMDKNEIRIKKLGALVEKAGGPAAFARKYSIATADKPIDDSYVSQLLNGHRNFGEKASERMAKRAGLPPDFFESDETHIPEPREANKENFGYQTIEHLSPKPSMGKGSQNFEPTQIVRNLNVLESWLKESVGITDPKRIKVLTATGRSMEPTISDQDLVFVDIENRFIDAPGIYVINVDDRLLLKKILILSDGTIVLRSDNQAEFPDEERLSADDLNERIHICGKVKAWWSLRKG